MVGGDLVVGYTLDVSGEISVEVEVIKIVSVNFYISIYWQGNAF